MDVGRYDAGDEEEAVYEGVGVGACEEENGEGREEEVDEGEAEAGEHVGGGRRGSGWEVGLRGCCAMGHFGDVHCGVMI